MRVLDSDVLIDVLRGHPPALAWFSTFSDDLAVPGFALLELIEGCRNQREVMSVMRAAASWQVYWPSAQHSATALDLLARFYLSHNLGPFDALIAATALGLQAPLCTFNVRHFRAVPGLVTEQPYPR